ncbi:hypothetical protein JCM17960_33690 [Magnetospira thiophila]
MAPPLDDAQIAQAVTRVLPSPKHKALLESVARAIPGVAFELAVTRDGWYRTGGILVADGSRIAHNLRDWAESTCDGDVTEIAAEYLGEGYVATRLQGRTHYLMAATGDGPMDFIQVEVEEIQEMTDRPLLDPDFLPDDIEDLVDPMDAPRLTGEPCGGPRYELRRATDFSPCLESPDSKFCGDAFFRRFLGEWIASSAAQAVRLHEHWVFTMVPYTDRFGEPRFYVKPRPQRQPGNKLDGKIHGRGSDLARLIHAFDRASDYPMAWYFHMVTGCGVSHIIAEAALDDLMGAYAYLPAKDLAILRKWGKEPYQL